MNFESKFGLGEIVIREQHKNGVMVREQMMEVISICFGLNNEIAYICECSKTGYRQQFTESMLVGDPDFNQEKGCYPIDATTTGDTNKGK